MKVYNVDLIPHKHKNLGTMSSRAIADTKKEAGEMVINQFGVKKTQIKKVLVEEEKK